MSGHNKWSTIKHKKGRVDAKRGRIFTRLNKEITVAARLGGGDPDGNPRLRAAITAARSANMPLDNIERGIKKGTGELEGVSYEEVLYEGYGPAGVAVLVEAVTDNKQRTVADVRHIFNKYGGALAEPNAVAWQFEQVGEIIVEAVDADEDDMMMAALEAGADDLANEDGVYVVRTSMDSLFEVQKALEEGGMHPREANLTYNAKNLLDVTEAKAASVLRMLDALDDCDDVQKLHTNAALPEVEGE
jgi:YebC/PmpR family DNA-binding regulatory protein